MLFGVKAIALGLWKYDIVKVPGQWLIDARGQFRPRNVWSRSITRRWQRNACTPNESTGVLLASVLPSLILLCGTGVLCTN